MKLKVTLLLILALLCFAAYNSQTESAPQASPVRVINLDELSIMTNEYRAQNGLQVLERNTLLDQASREKCEDMKNKGYWAHDDGTKAFYYFIKEQVPTAHIYGENLAADYSSSDEIVQAWKNSPTHDKNLKAEYTHVGYANCGQITVQSFIAL